jgi:hypothetical protein
MFELEYSEQDLMTKAAKLQFDEKLLHVWRAYMEAGNFRRDAYII